MGRQDFYEQIEKYLDGSLPDAEKTAFEKRLADDADFRKQVALHRAVHEDFGNLGKFNFQKTLAEVMQEPLATPISAETRLKKSLFWKWGIGSAVFLALAVGIFWKQKTTADLPKPVSQPPTEKTNPQPATKLEPPPVRIARANPADFEPNPVLEPMLSHGTTRGSFAIQLSKPVSDAAFFSKNGQVSIEFQGIALTDELTENEPLWLRVFSNRPDAMKNPPVFEEKFVIGKRENQQTQFSLRPKIALPPGLFYFLIEKKGA